MHAKSKNAIALWGLVLLGIAMIVIGAMGMMAPPVITGVGFILIAWWIHATYSPTN